MMTDPAVRRRGPYAKTARVRRGVVEAGAELFAAHGFRATTLRMIADRAGISERGLGHHFAGKADVLAEVLADREAANARFVTLEPGLAALLGIIRVVASESTNTRLVELHSTLSAEASAPEHPAHDYYHQRYRLLHEFAALSFSAARQAGEVRSPLDDEDLASILLALSDGAQLQWLYDQDSIEPAQLLRRFLHSVGVAVESPGITAPTVG